MAYTTEGNVVGKYNMVEEVWGLLARNGLLYTVRDRGVTISDAKGEFIYHLIKDFCILYHYYAFQGP